MMAYLFLLKMTYVYGRKRQSANDVHRREKERQNFKKSRQQYEIKNLGGEVESLENFHFLQQMSRVSLPR
jgi:hypothetical protein